MAIQVDNTLVTLWDGLIGTPFTDIYGGTANQFTTVMDAPISISANYLTFYVNYSYIDSNLTHYPVPLILDGNAAEAFLALGANYKHMRMRDAAGNELFVEVVAWDDSGQTAELHISRNNWVISSSENTYFYLYYDRITDSSFVGAQGTVTAANVWDANYAAVHHLQDDNCLDSTSGNHDGTLINDAAIVEDGKLTQGMWSDYGGGAGDDAMIAPDHADFDITDKITTQGWVKFNATGGHGVITAKMYNGVATSASCWQLGNSSTAEFRWAIGSRFDVSPAAPKLTTDIWYYLVGTYDSTSGDYNLLVDNVSIANGTASGAIRTSEHDYAIAGREYDGDVYYSTDGTTDEVRTSNVIRSDAWLKADYYTQYGTAVVSTAPWLGTWAKRIRIAIDSTNIDSDQIHYPIPISLGTSVGQNNDDISAIFDEVGANSKKIAITQSDGITQNYVEIQQWDEGGEDAILWTSISGLTIASDTDTILYIYYDNTEDDNTTYVSDTGSGASENVWDSNYMLVCHMNTTSFLDSTSRGHDGTNNGAVISTGGKLGSAADFEVGENDWITFPDHSDFDLTSALTLQCWHKQETGPENDSGRFIAKSYDSVTTGGCCWQLTTLGQTPARFRHAGKGTVNWDVLPTSPTITPGTWYLQTSTWSDASGHAILYVDDTVIDDTDSLTGAIRTSDQVVSVGASVYDATETYFWDGLIDEVRISDIVRTPAWLKVDYYSENDNILTFENEETL